MTPNQRSMLVGFCAIALLPLACRSEMRSTRTVSYDGPYRSTDWELVTETVHEVDDDFDRDVEEQRHVIEVEYDD